MRVALVCPYDLGAPGGVQTQAIGLARALAALDVEVRLIAPGATAPDGTGDLDLVLVGAAHAVPANGSRAPVALGPGAARRAARALERFRPDLVHLEEPLVPLVGAYLLVRARVPLVGTFHRAGASLSYRAIGRTARPLLARLDAAVAVSLAARATARSVLGPSAAVALVPNAVDPLRFAAEAQSERSGILFVGRHEPRKGLTVLLEAVAALDESVQLRIASDGPLRARLEAAFAHDARVTFLGRLSDGEIAAELGRAAVLAAPSLGGESFGVVLIEAMAAGAAVVCSDLPGYREAAGDAARFVPAGDVAALSQSLADVLTDEARRAELCDAGRRRVERFSFIEQADRYVEIYAAVLGRRLGAGPAVS